MGGLLTLGSWVKQFPEINTVDNPGDNHIATIQGISVASYNVGCFVGAVITIFIGDILGRRKMIFLGSCIMVVGAILQCSAFSLAHLIVGRIVTGFGNGRSSSSVLFSFDVLEYISSRQSLGVAGVGGSPRSGIVVPSSRYIRA